MTRLLVVFCTLFLLQCSTRASSCQNGLKLYGKVSDAHSHLNVSGATVTTVGDDACEPAISDNSGLFILRLTDQKKNGDIVRVRTEKDGYDVFDQLCAVSPLTLEITLTPTNHEENKSNPHGKDPQMPRSSSSSPPITGRTLSDWQRVVLTARLSTQKRYRLLLLVADTKESLSYAENIREFFTSPSIGWQVDGPHLAPKEQPVMDLQLSVSDDYWGNAPESVRVLRNAMKEVKLPIRDTFISDPNVPDSDIALWVGPPSPNGENNRILPLTVGCQNPIPFTSENTTSMTAIPTPTFTKLVKVPPLGNRFAAQESFRMFFSQPITSFGANSPVRLEVVGRVMVNNDEVQVTVNHDMPIGEPLLLYPISDKDFQVTCVERWNAD